MKKCKSCLKQIDLIDVRFCPYCGLKLADKKKLAKSAKNKNQIMWIYRDVDVYTPVLTKFKKEWEIYCFSSHEVIPKGLENLPSNIDVLMLDALFMKIAHDGFDSDSSTKMKEHVLDELKQTKAFIEKMKPGSKVVVTGIMGEEAMRKSLNFCEIKFDAIIKAPFTCGEVYQKVTELF